MKENNKVLADVFCGINLAKTVLDLRFDDVERVFIRKGEEGRFGSYLSRLAQNKKVYRLVPQEELNKIAGSEHHEGICLFAKPKKIKSLKSLLTHYISNFHGDPLIILDQVNNPHNIGSIYRAAAFFGFTNIVLVSKSTLHLSGSLARVSEGGTELIDTSFAKSEILIPLLKELGIHTLVTDVRAETSDLPFEYLSRPYAIVLGSENNGVSKEFFQSSSFLFKIDGSGRLESLNVGMSAGIIFNSIFVASKT